MAKKALIFLADGFEEVEAVTPIDYVRRAGIAVTTISLNESGVSTGAHGIPVRADMSLAELAGAFRAEDWDAALVPGGMPGARNVAASEEAGRMLKALDDNGKIIAAICAAPVVVLYPLGLLDGRPFTCYPGMEAQAVNGVFTAGDVVVGGNVITSRGAGTAAQWSFMIIRQLEGGAAAENVASAVVSGVRA